MLSNKSFCDGAMSYNWTVYPLTTSHLQLLNTWNVVSEAEKLSFISFHFNDLEFKFSSI